MKRFVILSWLLVSLTGSVPSWADDADVNSLKGEVQSLREELNALRNELKSVKAGQSAGAASAASAETVSKNDLDGVRGEVLSLRDEWQRTRDFQTPTVSRSLALSGTVVTKYTQTRDETAKSGFALGGVTLNFKGNLRKDYEWGRNLDYVFGLTTGTTDSFRVAPTDAYISYSPVPSLDLEKPRLVLSVGQQKKPFGRDPQTTEEYKPTINTAKIDSTLGLGTRDIGIIAKGDLLPVNDYGFNYRVPLLEYSAGVVNGAGPNIVDNNNEKDLVARVGINAPVDYNSIFRGLSAGISGWTGQKSLSLGSGATAITRRGKKDRWGYDVAYNRTPVGFTAEYAQGLDETLGGTVGHPNYGTTKSDGYIGTVFYNFGQQFFKGKLQTSRYDDWYPLTYQPFVRFERYDPNKQLSHDTVDITTLGFNWFFAPTTKLQLNYNIYNNENKTGSNGAGYNEVIAQFQYGF